MRGDAVVPGPDIVIHAEDSKLAGMCEYVQHMHQDSGLTELVRTSTVTLAQAQDAVVNFLQTNNVQNGVIAGSSVHFDRKFLLRSMPRLFDGCIHPTDIFNVSTLNVLSAAWYRRYSPPDKQSRHRSLDDIQESLQEYRFYLQTIIKQEQP